MKKLKVIGSLLFCVFGRTAPIHAAQQEVGQVIKQKITKHAKTVAAHARVLYKGSPQFVSIEGTSISYAANTPDEVINIDDAFYLSLEGVWLESANAQGPWIALQLVPEELTAIVCSLLSFNPYDPYQLCALPWTSEQSYAVWKSS
jgi:hypothetical protein